MSELFFERDKDKKEIEQLREKLKQTTLQLSLANQRIRILEGKTNNFRKIPQCNKYEALGNVFCLLIKLFFFWLRQELKESQSEFVSLVQVCLELSIFIILAQVSCKSLKAFLSYLVEQREPKILCPVISCLKPF